MMDLLSTSPFVPAREPKILIIADWLPPDFGAVGQYMQMRARALAEQGHDVTLIGLASAGNSSLSEAIGEGRLTELRLAASPVPRTSLFRRLLWTIWTDLRLVAAAFKWLRRADGILFTGSPPFLIHFLAPLRFLWPGRLIYRITDFHPECLIAARDRPSWALSLLLSLTNFWRRRIDGFEVLGLDQRRRLEETGVPQTRMTLVRDGSPVTFTGREKAEPLPPALADAVVLLYSGNYGVAHEIDTVVEGYERHHRLGTARVCLWLSATGGGADQIAAELNRRSLPFHRSAPVPLERLSGLLVAPDAHLVTLKDPFVGFVMPSKIYACIGSRRPVLFVGSGESDVDLIARAGGSAYWHVVCGDVAGFSAALEGIADLARAEAAGASPGL
jgi:hypothetical protein